MSEPISDEELANLRVWLGRFPETNATTTLQLKSLIARIDLERNRADEAERRIEYEKTRRDVLVDMLSDYERLRGYVALRHGDGDADPSTVAQWLADNGHGLFVEGVPEVDEWRERLWPTPPSVDDEITEIIYEDALVEGEEWAEESHSYRRAALAAPPDPKEGT